MSMSMDTQQLQQLLQQMQMNQQPSVGGGYSMPMPQQVQFNPQQQALMDPTLMAQRAILGRQPVQYQPLLTPQNYQDFYSGQTSTGGTGLLAPDYLAKANAAALAVPAVNYADYGGGYGDGGTGYSTNGGVSFVAPVTDAITGAMSAGHSGTTAFSGSQEGGWNDAGTGVGVGGGSVGAGGGNAAGGFSFGGW